MKTKRFLALGLLLGSCAISAAQDTPAPAPPQEAPATRPARPQRQMPPGMIEKYDKDGDGKLSPDEMKAMQDQFRADREAAMKKYDKDGDGQLSGEERQAMRTDMEAQRKVLVEKYDANKNGKLDPEEFKAAREAGENIPIMGRGQGQRQGGQGRGRSGPQGEGQKTPPPAPAPEAPAGE